MDTDDASVLEALEAAVTAAQAMVTRLWQRPEPEVVEALRRVHRLNARLQSLQLSTVREVETRGVPGTVGAVSTRAFLSQALIMSPGLAGEHTKMSDRLATRYVPTGQALAAGRISYEQAKAIVDTLDGLSAKATVEDLDRAEAFLLGQAPVLNASDLRRCHKHLDAVIDPDGQPDREEAARLKRGANIHDHHDGTQTLKWTDTDEHIAVLKAALDAMSAPVPGQDGERDPRTPAVRRADALLDLCLRTLNNGELPNSRGVRPHLHVTFTAATWHRQPGAPHGRTATGEELSPATIERLACDADITGVLLTGDGIPLKVGRTHRTVTPGQWIALLARDTGCTFPACTRPASWCEAHHLIPWGQDGQTDIDKMGLVCKAHHHFIHDKGWIARIGPHGHVEFVPPPLIDPTRTPRRNTHWRTRADFAAHAAP